MRTLRPLAALALVALAAAGCSNGGSERGAGTASSTGTPSGPKLTAREKAVKFSECMRANGVSEFPGPKALTTGSR